MVSIHYTTYFMHLKYMQMELCLVFTVCSSILTSGVFIPAKWESHGNSNLDAHLTGHFYELQFTNYELRIQSKGRSWSVLAQLHVKHNGTVCTV